MAPTTKRGACLAFGSRAGTWIGVALGLWLMYVVTGLLVTAAAGVWLLGLKGKFDIARPDTRG